MPLKDFLDWLVGNKPRQNFRVKPVRTSAPSTQPKSLVVRPERGAVYLSPEVSKDVFTLKAGELPPVRLVIHKGQGWLRDTKHYLLVVPGNRYLASAGVFTLNVRGTKYNAQNYRGPRLVPGDLLSLVREPDNEYDSNAIAVCRLGHSAPLGYVNKGLAKRLAKRLDAGEVFEARVLRYREPFSIAISTPEFMQHIFR